MIQDEVEKGKAVYQNDRLKEAEHHFTTALDLLADIEKKAGGILSPLDLDLKAKTFSNRGRVRRDLCNYTGSIEERF